MSKISKLLYFIISAIFFTLFDGYFSDLLISEGYKLPENQFFDLTFVQNEGAAFSILQGSKIFLIAFSLFAILGIIFYTIKHIKNAPIIGIFCSAMLVSGIFSNMLERINYGFVRDFIKLNFIDFPVFNISDIFINLSVLVIVIIIIKHSYIDKKDETNN